MAGKPAFIMNKEQKAEIKISLWKTEIDNCEKEIENCKSNIAHFKGMNLAYKDWYSSTGSMFDLIKANLDYNRADNQNELEEPKVRMSDSEAQKCAEMIKPILAMNDKKIRYSVQEPERFQGQILLLAKQIESFNKQIAFESSKDFSDNINEEDLEDLAEQKEADEQVKKTRKKTVKKK